MPLYSFQKSTLCILDADTIDVIEEIGEPTRGSKTIGLMCTMHNNTRRESTAGKTNSLAIYRLSRSSLLKTGVD